MSAWMCEPETIYNVATYIYWCREHYLKKNDNYSNTVYWKLIEMNRDALKSRYPEKYEEMIGDDAEYEAYPTSIKDYYNVKHGFGLLTMINCLMYQCTEGDVPETNPLYEELKQARIILMEDIITKLENAIGFDVLQYWK